MTHYDVIMEITSNVITYCDVIMSQSSAHNGISTGDLGKEIPFKTGYSTV